MFLNKNMGASKMIRGMDMINSVVHVNDGILHMNYSYLSWLPPNDEGSCEMFAHIH